MRYELCIEGTQDTITITDKNVIQKIDFEIYQNDKQANDRSDQLKNTLTIVGLLNEKSKNETRQILEWSMQVSKERIYKTVSIQIYVNEVMVRDYYLRNMFCTSYSEKFSTVESGENHTVNEGNFILVMTQQKGSIDTIKVES